MNWKFWQREKRRGEVCACGSVHRAECHHDFTNWTAPQAATVKAIVSVFSGAAEDREMMVQTRTCLRCNLFERRFC